MKTSLLSALLLLGFASSGMAWDWELSNIQSFNTDIPYSYMTTCLGEEKAAGFAAGMQGCTAGPTLNDANWLLNNIANPTCPMFEKFNQLLVQHELCLADVCQTVHDDATINEDRINWIFEGTVLEDEIDDMTVTVYDCAGEAYDFMDTNGDDIVSAWQNGAGVCGWAVLDDDAIRRIVERVAVSNCVKRTFVNTCEAFMNV